jgi:uncharacterized membrane protein YccC
MLSLALNIGLLVGLGRFVTLPTSAYAMTVVMSMIGSTAIRDDTPRAQLITRVYATVAAIACFVVAGVLATNRIAVDLAFLAVIFFAVLARRWAARGTAVGMLAFMAFYMGDYLRPKLADSGLVAVAVVIALLGTQLVSAKLVRNDKEKDFRRALVTIDRRLDLLLHDLLAAPKDGALPADSKKVLQRHLARLRDIVLMAEGFLPQGEGGALAATGPSAEVALALFELQLASERVVGASWFGRPDGDLIHAVLEHEQARLASTRKHLETASEDEDVPARALLRLDDARSKLATALGPAPSPVFAVDGSAPTRTPPRPPEEPKRWGIPGAFHAPIQVTLACAVALELGFLVSPTRWSWAVLSAFIVFANTKSRADAAVRALERSAGTLAGLAGGVLVATLLRESVIAAAIGIVIAFALSIYFQAVSASLNLLLSTIALVLLYGMMGMFTPNILALRLGETVVGSVAAVLAAFAIFPSHASVVLGDALRDYLGALDTFVLAVRKRARSEDAGNLIALAHVLDHRYASLATSARPVGGPWEMVTRFGNVRGKLLLLTGCTQWARTLARSLAHAKLEPDAVARIDVLVDQITERTSKLSAVRLRWFERRPDDDASPQSLRTLPRARENDPTFSLQAISGLLARALDEAPLG